MGLGRGRDNVRRHFGLNIRQPPPPSLTSAWVAQGSTTSTTASQTFTGANFGAADANRFLVIAIRTGTNNRTVSSVTIGGVAATQICQTTGSSNGISMWFAKVPTNGSGNIVIVRSSPDNSMQYNMWSVIGPNGVLNVIDSAAFVGTGTDNWALACVQHGVVLFNSSAASTDTYTLTNIAQDQTNIAGSLPLSHIVALADGTTWNGTIVNDQGHAQQVTMCSLGP